MTDRSSMLTQAPLDGGRLLPNDGRNCTSRRIRCDSGFTESRWSIVGRITPGNKTNGRYGRGYCLPAPFIVCRFNLLASYMF
jgi:hypothetical protein